MISNPLIGVKNVAIVKKNALKNVDIKSGVVYIKTDNTKENILLKF